MQYGDAIKFLYDLSLFGAKFGLENTRRLAAAAGNPQQRLRFIHVAGTNGKGSTCAMLESIYRAAGLRVGLFTSPHLVLFGERIQVNRQMISPPRVVELVEQLRPRLAPDEDGVHPTFFEAVTVMALIHFASEQCDLVVWETGLGGRLDATNIVAPLASVITNIALEHQQWLGETHAQIAAEKAGIIKPGVPVITATLPGEGREVIAAKASELGAPLTTVEKADAHRPPCDDVALPLLGEHQRVNAAVAVATVRVLQSVWSISEEQIRQGLERVQWPGRLQVVQPSASQTILLDGAHNPDGATALAAALGNHFAGVRPTLIFGAMSDKDHRAMLAPLAPLVERVLAVPLQSERALRPEQLTHLCREAFPALPVQPCASLAAALQEASADAFVVIAGSLYLIGEAMEHLRLSPVSGADERALNTWTQSPSPLASASRDARL